MNKADWKWIKEAIQLLEDTVVDYPEIFSSEDEEILNVAQQIVEENSK